MRKIILAILMCISCSIATLMAEPLKIDGLTCENLKAPLAIDNTQPHFSWLNHATFMLYRCFMESHCKWLS